MTVAQEKVTLGSMQEVIAAIKGIEPEIKNYSIAKRLRELGISITVQGIDSYEKGTKSARLDVLAGIQLIWFRGKEKHLMSLIKQGAGLEKAGK